MLSAKDAAKEINETPKKETKSAAKAPTPPENPANINRGNTSDDKPDDLPREPVVVKKSEPVNIPKKKKSKEDNSSSILPWLAGGAMLIFIGALDLSKRAVLN